MAYRFATENVDYSDYASGRVFYAAPGHPALPARLVSEVFQRCQAIRQSGGLSTPVTIYDPCCGSAYHLMVLAYLHWSEIKTIIASDIDLDILTVAERNLNLLTVKGLENRAKAIHEMVTQFEKKSHVEAEKSVRKFQHQLEKNLAQHPIDHFLFTADATSHQMMEDKLKAQSIDVVIADIPYGHQSQWQTSLAELETDLTMLDRMLDSLLHILAGGAVVAIVADKGQKATHSAYQKVGRFRIGKRQVFLLQLA